MYGTTSKWTKRFTAGLLVFAITLTSCDWPVSVDEVTEVSQSYHFTYDAYDNVTKISVGNRTLATYEYGPKNGPLVKMTYGNGDAVEYEHDALGRIVLEKRNGVAKLRYVYQCEGAIGRQEELGADGSVIRAVCYEYDSLGRVIRSWEEALEGGSMVRQKVTEHLYDTSDRLTEQSYQLEDGTKYSETYQYNTDDGSLDTMKTTSGEEIQYNYDSLKRLWGSWDGRKNISYVYENVGSTGTSNQVAQMQIRGVGNGIFFAYEYDTLGNITKVTRDGTAVEYIYDEQSQLIEERYPSFSEYWHYEYDTAGNIRKKRKDKSAWSWTTTFDYTDSQWGDLLTSVNVKGIKVEAGASASIADSLVYNKGKIDITNTASAKVNASLGVWELSVGTGKEHSFFDEKCECNILHDPYVQQMNCAAGTEIEPVESTIGFSIGGYLLLEGEISLVLDLNELHNELINIFTEP